MFVLKYLSFVLVINFVSAKLCKIKSDVLLEGSCYSESWRTPIFTSSSIQWTFDTFLMPIKNVSILYSITKYARLIQKYVLFIASAYSSANCFQIIVVVVSNTISKRTLQIPEQSWSKILKNFCKCATN